MTQAEKIAMVKILSDETDDSIISAVLTKAAEDLYPLADPFKTRSKEDVVDENAGVQVDMAAWLLNKRGWDFEVSHSENGVSRVYESGGYPQSILNKITSKVGAVK